MSAKPKQWSRKYDACVDCGRTDRPHKARGSCLSCYSYNGAKHKLARQDVLNCIECDVEFKRSGKKRYCSKTCCHRRNERIRNQKRHDLEYVKEKRKSGNAAPIKDAIYAEYKRWKRNTDNRKKDIGFYLNLEEFEELIFDNCFYCGEGPKIPSRSGYLIRSSIDRVDSDLDYIYSNCVTSCYECNIMKNVLPQDVFLDKINKIANYTKSYLKKNPHQYTLQDRVQMYNNAFPNYPCMRYDSSWLIGMWSIGACYKGSGWYGSYPYKYLLRMRTLFPEFSKNEVLHLFSGSLSPGYDGKKDWSEDFPGITFDKNAALGPDIVGDAENVSNYFDKKFSIVLSDCPYSKQDAKKYGFAMINRKKVVHECYKILKPGGFLIWLDEVLPMYRKTEFKRVGEIGITRSTNHRIRAAIIFQKAKDEQKKQGKSLLCS